MEFTRREATKLVLSGAGLALAPLPLHARSNEEWAARLQDRLNGALVADCEGRFRVAAFGQANSQGQIQMAAVIELRWPPGFRSRRLHTFADSDETAFATLQDDALAMFHRAWPDCVRRTG